MSSSTINSSNISSTSSLPIVNDLENITSSKRTTSKWVVDPNIKDAVDKYITDNPDRHRFAEQYGDTIMTSRFANVDQFKIDTRDVEGEEVLFNKLIQDISNYGITEGELFDHEVKILYQRLGPTWRQVFRDALNSQ
jgi:hypothetical protein